MDKEVYIIAGPNGAGKTQFISQQIPMHVPVVNGDLIHKEMFSDQEPSPATEEEAKAAAIAMIIGYIKKKNPLALKAIWQGPRTGNILKASEKMNIR